VNVNGGAQNAASWEELVDSELSRSLAFLIVATNYRSAGNVTSANREELSAHRAYQEALYLFKVLRHLMRKTAARRLALRIKEIGNAIHGG
jgi:hypothetical protein